MPGQSKSRSSKSRKSWKELSPRTKALARTATRTTVALGEGLVETCDAMAFPTSKLRQKQENYIRGKYKEFNRLRKLVWLEPKTYKRINSKGGIEEIR